MEPVIGLLIAGSIAFVGFLLRYTLNAKDQKIIEMQKQLDELYDKLNELHRTNSVIDNKLDNVIDLVEKLGK
jgi:hypothetical protein